MAEKGTKDITGPDAGKGEFLELCFWSGWGRRGFEKTRFELIAVKTRGRSRIVVVRVVQGGILMGWRAAKTAEDIGD